MEIKGTGLGLSIVKRAVEAHHGTITVSSTPGRETKFLMTIPKAAV
jgi:signal transduction histidine kinase